MRKFVALSALIVASHFATAAETLPQVAAPPAASNSFQPAVSGQPSPLPGDFGPPGAADAQITAQAQAEAARISAQQQAEAYAAQQRLMNRPNASNQSSNASQILNAFMNLFNGGNASGGGKTIPQPYLPNGQINPEFESYVRGGGKLPGGISYSNGFVPSDGGPEIQQSFSGLCEKYPIANLDKNFAGYNCDTPTNDRMTCMVCNIYFEAGNQGTMGQVAVGQSSLHRLFSTQYAKKGEGLCDVVYRKTNTRPAVAQYSWTVDRRSHRLPSGSALRRVVDSAQKSLCGGPNKWTNYYGPDSMIPRGRVPAWWNQDCQPSSKQDIEKHRFCTVGGKMNRSIAEVMASEGVSSVAGAAVSIPEPAQGVR